MNVYCYDNSTHNCSHSIISCTNNDSDSCNIYCEGIHSCDYSYIDCGTTSDCFVDCYFPASCSNSIINASMVTNTFEINTFYPINSAYAIYAKTIENTSIYCPFTNKLFQHNCYFTCSGLFYACEKFNIYAKNGSMKSVCLC